MNFFRTLSLWLTLSIIGLSMSIMIAMGTAFYTSESKARDQIINDIEQGASQLEATLVSGFSDLGESQEAAASDALFQKARSVGEFVARLSPESLLTFELEDVNYFCQIAHLDSDIALCFVRDSAGDIVTRETNSDHARVSKHVTGDSPALADLAAALEDDPDVVKLVVDITLSDERVGEVVVFADRSMEYQAAAEIQTASETTVNAASAGLEGLREQAYGSIEQARKGMAALLIPLNIGILIGAAVIAIALAGFITRPLRGLRKISEAGADGDLTVEIPRSVLSEINGLSNGFRSLVHALRDILANVRNTTVELAESSTELNHLSDQLHQGAEGTKSRSEVVAAAAEQMSVSMSSMVDTSRSMTDCVDAISRSMESVRTTSTELASSSGDASADIRQATEIAESSNEQLKDLDESAAEIGSVMKLIQEISEQTNLLALNASIEAARAGEHGRGFAVVAEEVKKLADQTATASEDIRQRVVQMQSSTGDSVTALGRISEVIGSIGSFSSDVVSAISEQETLTTTVSEYASSAQEGTLAVANAIEETSTATGDIAVSIGEVDRMAAETLTAASSAKPRSENLGELAQRLESLVGRFQI